MLHRVILPSHRSCVSSCAEEAWARLQWSQGVPPKGGWQEICSPRSDVSQTRRVRLFASGGAKDSGHSMYSVYGTQAVLRTTHSVWSTVMDCVLCVAIQSTIGSCGTVLNALASGQKSEKSVRIYFVSQARRHLLAQARTLRVRYQDTHVLGLLHDDANR